MMVQSFSTFNACDVEKRCMFASALSMVDVDQRRLSGVLALVCRPGAAVLCSLHFVGVPLLSAC